MNQKTTLLEAQLNSSIDGIIIVNSQGKKILQNQRAIDLWKIPQHIADNEDDNLQVQHVMHMTKNPEKFVNEIKNLYAHPEVKSFDDVELVDGTFLERYSAPVLDKNGKNYGRIWIFHDITKRKRTEETINSLAKFPSENPDPVLRISKEGILLFANEASYSFFNWKLETGKAAPEVLRKIVNDSFKQKSLRKIEIEHNKGIFSVHVVPILESNYTNLYIRDITKRKLGEKEILILAHSLSSVNECVSITDLEDKIIFVNDSFLKTYGYRKNELVGKNINIVRSQNNPVKLVEKILPATLKGGWKGELLNKKKDGSEFPIQLSTTMVKDKDGKPLGLIGVAADITERKRIENELIKAKDKAEVAEIQLLSILENSPTGFAINAISTGKVKYVNKAFSNIYHIPIELCQNVESFFEYVYGDQMELGSKILDDIKSGDPERMKWDLIPVTDKTTKNVHYVSAANIMLKDQDLMISSVWDVTSQVQNEEKLIAALDKATESDRLKSAFLANMSHEIRTPMNGILGFSQLLKTPKLTGEEQQIFIDVIEKSGTRMLNIINDIINISRIESEQVEVSISETNINRLVIDIFNFFKPEADSKKLNLTFKNTLPSDESNY